MMIRTHVPTGVAAAMFASKILNIRMGIYYLAAAAIGSMLPDIDHPQGKLNQRILLVNNKMGKIVTYILLAYLTLELYIKNSNMTFLIYLIPVFAMIALSKHRGITHSILGTVIMIFLVYKLEPILMMKDITVGFAIGYVMHILADCFTHNGVEVLFPNRKNYHFPITIRTNGIVENLVSLGAVAMCFYLYLGKAIWS